MAFAAAETYFVVVSSSSDNTVGNILIIFFTLLLFGRVGFEVGFERSTGLAEKVPSRDLVFLHMVQFFH